MNTAQEELSLWAERGRDQGTKRALSADPDWSAEAWNALLRLASSGAEFSSDDLRREVGPGPSNGSLGAVTLNGLRGGWIRNINATAAGTVRAHKRSIGIYCGTGKKVA